MNVKPIMGWNEPPEPLREVLKRNIVLSEEMGDGEWVDFGDLLSEPARNLPWYTLAWYWIRRQDPIWWFRHRTIDRYHVVGTGLPPGYYDKDTQILHACFMLLVDFVERECGGVASLKRQATWGGRHGAMATECLALYWWWTEIRSRRGEEFDMEAVYEAKDDEMLARLVKVRRWLWT